MVNPALRRGSALALSLVTISTGLTAALAVAPASAAQVDGLTSVTPTRLLDTRAGLGAAKSVVAGGSTVKLKVTQLAGVPADAAAVVLNVTAVPGTAGGAVTVWDCSSPVPGTSSVNFLPGRPVANLTVPGVGADGSVCLRPSATTHLVADVNGFFTGSPSFIDDAPQRVLDTRRGLGAPAARVVPGATLTLNVADADAEAVFLNVTAVGASSPGLVQVWACDKPKPTIPSVNYVATQAASNLALTQPSAAGTVCLSATTATHLIVDTGSSLRRSAAYTPLAPQRLLDSRTTGGPLVANVTREVAVAGVGAVPAGAAAAALRFTVLGSNGPGTLTAFPCGSPVPATSTQNFRDGGAVANLALSRLGTGGKVCVRSTRATQVVVDVTGVFAAPVATEQLYLLRGGNVVERVDAGTLTSLASTTFAPTGATAQLGITAGTELVAIDVRPSTGVLYGLGDDGQVYSLNPGLGTSSKIGAPVAAADGGILAVGFDFNPSVDRIRVVLGNGDNLRLNPDSGALVGGVNDTDVDYPTGDPNAAAVPSLVGAAYTASTLGAPAPAPTATSLFVLDAATDSLAIVSSPNNGVLTTRGPVGLALDDSTGFDVSPATGRAFGIGAGDKLFTVDLTSGAATVIGTIAGSPVRGLAVVPVGSATPVDQGWLIAADGTITAISLADPDTAVATYTTTGLVGGTSVVGLDVRGATGMPYALGSDGQLYVLGVPKAASPTVIPFEPVGAATVSAFTGGVGFDVNPAVDRIRFLSGTDSRVINPNTGAETPGAPAAFVADDPGFGTTPNLRSAAYVNDVRGGVATSTTLFDLESTRDALVTQNVTTGGLTTVGLLGPNIGATGGFDVQRGTGAAFAVQTAGAGAPRLFDVDLADGGMTALSLLPAGVAPVGFAIR